MNAGEFLRVSVFSTLYDPSENEMSSPRLSHHRDDPNRDINWARPISLWLRSSLQVVIAKAELFPILQQCQEGEKEATAAKKSCSFVLGARLKKVCISGKKMTKNWTSN